MACAFGDDDLTLRFWTKCYFVDHSRDGKFNFNSFWESCLQGKVVCKCDFTFVVEVQTQSIIFEITNISSTQLALTAKMRGFGVSSAVLLPILAFLASALGAGEVLTTIVSETFRCFIHRSASE